MVNRTIKEEKSLKVLFNSFLFRWIARISLLRTTIWAGFYDFCDPCSVGAGEKKKSFLLVGVAKANFSCFAIEKKSLPQNNECQVEFILVFENV